MVLFADEAFWAGDKKGEETLKGLITEESLVFEEKFKDAYSIKNHLRIIMASNANWVIHARRQERSFFYTCGKPGENARSQIF